MTTNVGTTEQRFRLAFGALFILGSLFLDLPLWATTMLGLIGLIALLTGTLRYCPLWSMFGVNTCDRQQNA